MTSKEELWHERIRWFYLKCWMVSKAKTKIIGKDSIYCQRNYERKYKAFCERQKRRALVLLFHKIFGYKCFKNTSRKYSVWVGYKYFFLLPIRSQTQCWKLGWNKGSLQSFPRPLSSSAVVSRLLHKNKITRGLGNTEKAPQKITCTFNYSTGLPTLQLHMHWNNFWLDCWR